tara:strand:- start:737 stop:1450 length:714 start_codon:yes stop_codon:yes gene_type:complete
VTEQTLTTEQSDQVQDLAKAVSTVQGALRPAAKSATGQIGKQKTKYADLESIVAAAREVMAKHGLSVIQTGEVHGPDSFLATTLLHESGQWIRGRTPILTTANSGLTLAQTFGSAMTYARRYGLVSILGITTEDDDGAGAGHGQNGQRQQASGHTNGNGRQQEAVKDDDTDEVCIQFHKPRGDDWKAALKDNGFRWNGEKYSWRADNTAAAIEFLNACLRDCAQDIKWSRLPQAATA